MLSILAPIKLSKCFVTASALLCKITAADCYLRRHLEKCERAVLNKRGQFTPCTCMMRRARSSRHEGHNGAAFPLADRVTAKDARAPVPVAAQRAKRRLGHISYFSPRSSAQELLTNAKFKTGIYTISSILCKLRFVHARPFPFKFVTLIKSITKQEVLKFCNLQFRRKFEECIYINMHYIHYVCIIFLI
jgi:hypothetical protein